jgi:hypothetical protein
MVTDHKRGFVESRCYRSILVRLTEIAIIHSQETRTGRLLNVTFRVTVSTFCALSTPSDRHQQIPDLLIYTRYYELSPQLNTRVCNDSADKCAKCNTLQLGYTCCILHTQPLVISHTHSALLLVSFIALYTSCCIAPHTPPQNQKLFFTLHDKRNKKRLYFH